MTNVANTSRSHLVIPTKGGKQVSLAPGENRALEINADHPGIKAKVNANLLVIGGKAQTDKAAKTGTARVGAADPTPPATKATASTAAKEG